MTKFVLLVSLILGSAGLNGTDAATPVSIARLEYHITGASLRVTPSTLSVPKGVAGSVLVELADGSNAALAGAYVEATLRGPSFPARRVIGQVNQPLLLPPLPIVGDYQLDGIRLVRTEGTNALTLQEGVPSSVPIRVFDEVLVSRVTSRPLTLDEIRERGIVIDDKNFRAVEFEIGFVLDGKTIPVRFPVVAPAFAGNTEIIPAAELERRLAEAEAINNQLDLGAVLPKELETARLNMEIKGINFQVTEDNDQDLAQSIPPIPALMVVPGNVGFLNQFFSVQIFTENAAPAGSGLSVVNVKALLKLPPGPDLVVSTNYNEPGDDPLRFARVGPDKIIQPVQPIVRPGADGRTGTSDDIPRLLPGETGTGEFLVEGLQEGLHVMDLDLTADLEGLVAGIVKIKGKAAGSVLVRNPKFSLAFSHPRTVRAGEPYDLYVSILNTSSSVANLVQVVMAAASISGGDLESAETVVLGTIQPGQTLTAKFHIRATRTGAISFSNLSTSDDSLVGRFRLRGGFDERGVALSPDTIGMPSYVTNLPPALVDAANRVLGQALSVATAGQLPANVKPIGKSIITSRVLELAEAGQRVQYGDPLAHVLPDLLLDWQGARSFNAGFDQIVRETDAGREWREAVALHLDQADGLNAVSRLAKRLPDLAGRGEPWAIFAIDTEAGAIRFGDGVNGRLPPETTTNLAPRYDRTNSASGLWFVTQPATNLVFEWQPRAAVPVAELALALIETNGTARQLRWTVTNLSSTACLRYDASDPSGALLVDRNCDGTNDATVAASVSTVRELPPSLISARQDPSVLAGRPTKICSTVTDFPLNYGTVLAVLFSKPLTQDRVNVPAAYTMENGNVAGSVQIQPGGRVALLNMRQPFGALRSRTMTVDGVNDPRGNTLLSNTVPVLSNLRGGAAVRGRVARADGSPAAGVPVTLTYYDQVSVGLGGCEDFIVRPAQVFTDGGGYFDFDFVVSGIPYSISATDTLGLSRDAIALILESTRADEFQRSKLLELVNSAGAQNTLLADFAVGALTDVVAKAEGLDRALLRDFIASGSPREGTEVPVALRFRGRGAVAGRVVSSDGVTPVSRVAVNLFPDPASRELGRGLFTDGDGRFAFLGVPLGIFSIEANSGTGLSRTVAGVIGQPGQATNVLIVLSSAQVARTDLTGRVTESDNTTPHPGATAFIGKIDSQGRFCCVVSAPTADGDGFWRASGIPADTYVLMAVSRDGRRKGERRDVSVPTGVTNFASIALQGFGVVIGRVETAAGTPVVNAIVAGGEQLVRTTNNGTFRLTGVPTGLRTVSAGAERSGTNGNITFPAFSFPRLGSASVNVLPGVENFVVIRFDPKGSLIGRVVDETGTNAVTGINVALPELGGFQWVPVNSRGEFFFEGIALKKYTVSAPAPPVFNTDVSGILDTLGDSGSSEGELQAAIGEAFAIFTGAADPLLNGEGANFNPGRWGYVETELIGDNEIKNVTVQFFKSSTVAGKVLNGQGVPIGARVRLTGVGPGLNGAPITVLRGERNSDPALGTFNFERQSFIGSYGLQAASPFFPIVIVRSGFTTEIQPDDTNVVLQFPSARDVNGRLAGRVFNPDGSLVVSGVVVRISFSADYRIFTRADGTFDTQIGLPALQLDGTPGKGYFVEAEDLETGARGAASVTVMPGNTNVAGNFVEVRLLGRGALRVTVLQNDGTPAVGARLGYDQGSYPSDRLPLNIGPVTDSNGQALFLNLFEGYYGVCARFVSGPTALNGRLGAGVSIGQTNNVTIRLGPTGTIQGRFVKRDGVTPVTFAQVAVGAIGFATTDTNGFFVVPDVPLGTYRLASSDPVSGIGATIIAVLSFSGQTNFVQLIEQSLGEIRGAVIASDGHSFAPGVTVNLNFSDGIAPQRTVTTGPDGRFSFPGAPAGSFTLFAQHPLTRLTGNGSGVLPENAASFEINVPLQPLAAVTIAVLRPDGVTLAGNTGVTFGERGADTDAAGRATFGDLPLGNYAVTAQSRRLQETHSVGRTNVSLLVPGAAPNVVIVLGGVGRVSGQIFLSDGSTPAVGAVVTLSHLGDIERYTFNTTTDGNGRFSISNVAVGPYEVSTRSGTLGARVTGAIASDGEADTVSLTVEPSATIKGRLVRTGGVTPVANEDVNLTLPGRNLPGSLFRTGTNGLFEFTSLPLGSFRLQSTALRFNGIALRDGTLTFNGQTNDVGNLVMDEDDPRVVSATPSDTATGVPITTQVELVFNEALRSNTVDATGIYLQGPSNTVAASVQLLNDTNSVPRRVRLTPSAPLKSLTTYRIVVVDDNRQDAFGTVIGRGPQDLVGRPLIAPFLATFTTADNDPPLLLSISPTNGQIQIDPRAVMRLSFNEPIRETNFSVTLTGTNGPVPGVASVGLNGLVLAFAPDAPLAPNTTYSLAVSNIFDLAGNRAASEPFVAAFSTLDTLGPEIVSLTIVSNQPPVAGSTVQVEALLLGNEPGAGVRFTQDLNPIGVDTNAPFRVNVSLPANGATTVRAIATDRFGNDGPFGELTISTVSNQPPIVTLTRVSPATGPVFRGELFTLRVGATDDVSVTNVSVMLSGALAIVTNLPNGNVTDLVLRVPTNVIPGSSISVRARAADFAGALSTEAAFDLVVSNLNHRPVAGVVQVGPGGALELDGNDDQVFGPQFRDVVNNFTMELWVNPTAGHRITSELNTGAEAQGGMRYAIYPQHGQDLGNGNHAGAGISVGTNGISVAEHAGSYIPTLLVHNAPMFGWTHVAVVYENRQPRLYVNGAFARLGLASSRDVHPSAGISDFPPYGDYRGQVDEIRVWRGVRTEADIRSAMNQRLAGTEAGLIAYYRFDETNGTQVLNTVANSNHMVMAQPPAQPIRIASAAPVGGGAIVTNTSAALLPLALAGFDPDGDPVTAIITFLPAHGALFQTADGVTPGAAITNVPASVSHSGRRVIFRRQVGYTGPDEFRYLLNDGLVNSYDAFVQLDLITPLNLDTDGDGMPDVFEFANGLNPELNDASLDPDGDGLNNLAEFLAGTNPHNADTDGDGLPDGTDPDPLHGAIVCAPAPAGLIHWYAGDLDGRDLVGTSSGVLEGGVTAGNAGKVGGAFRFNGVSGGVNLGNVPDLDFAPDSSFTIEAWFNSFGPTALPNDGQVIVVLNNNCGNTLQGIVLSNGGADAGKVFFTVRDANHVSGFVGTSSPVASNQFHHVVGVREVNGGTKTLRLYVDGVLVDTQPDPSTGPLALDAPDLIGRRNVCGTENVFNGLIDDVSIYQSALTASDVRSLFAAGSLGKCVECVPLTSVPVAWWRAEDSFADAVGGFNGSPVNGAGFGAGRVGRAFHFDGVDDFVTVPDGPQWDFVQNDFTIELWVKFDRLKDTMFIHQQDGLLPGGFEFDFQTEVESPLGSNILVFARNPSDGTKQAWSPQTNVWYHLAATRSGPTYRLYVDGVQLGGDDVSFDPVANVAGPIRIGGYAVGDFGVAGSIDELSIYRRAFSASELQQIVAAGSLGKCLPTCTPLPVGALGWWSGNGDAKDRISADDGALLNGATFGQGLIGQAFNFDGVNSRVSIPDSPAYRFTNGFTMETWFRSAGTPDFSGLLDKFVEAPPNTAGFQLSFYGDTQRGTLRGDLGIGSLYVTVVHPKFVMDDRWHHAALTWDGSRILLYVDGVPGLPVGATNVLLNNTEALVLGMDNCCGNRNFNGLLDEVAIYDRGLSASEILAIYQAGVAGKCATCVPAPAGLLAWWQMEERSGLSALDAASGLNATLTGTESVAGTVGQARRFGENDQLEVMGGGILDLAGNQVTLEAWLKLETGPAGQQKFTASFGKLTFPGNQTYSIIFETGPNIGLPSNQWLFEYILTRQDGVRVHNQSTGVVVPADGTYHHAAMTYDGAAVRLYVDGVRRGEFAFSGNLKSVPEEPFRVIGAVPFTMDEVGVYSRALSEAEIQRLVSAGSAGKCVPQCSPAPSGLVGWWRGQTNALDQVGTNHGILRNGATFTNGMVGQAFSFNGTGQFVEIPSAPSLVITGAISIEAWLFPRHPTFGSVVLSKTAGRPNRAGWLWQWAPDGRLQFQVDGDGQPFNGVEREVQAVAGTVPSNTWTHVVTTFEPATQAMKIYANGVEAATTLTIGGTVNGIFPTTDPIRISGFQGVQSNPTLHFFGFVDEVSLYNRALTAAEVGALFDAGSLGKCLSGVGDLEEPPAGALRVGQFSFSGQPQGGSTQTREMTLRWTAPPGRHFTVEQSEDLVQWREAGAVVAETAPGVYAAVLPVGTTGSAFYRLRRD